MARSANALTSRLGARTDRPGSGGREPALCLYRRSLVDLVDRLAQRAVEFLVAHLVAQVGEQSAREAGDHAVVLRTLPAGLRSEEHTSELQSQMRNSEHVFFLEQ